MSGVLPLPDESTGTVVEIEAADVPGGTTNSGKKLQGLNSRQVQEYYVNRLRALDVAHDATLAALADQAAVEAYQTDVRAKLLSCLGPFPTAPALNAATTGTLDRTGYTVEKVLFDSLVNSDGTRWIVSGNLYVPDAAAATPAPGILVLCGHDPSGKYAYQSYAQGLAKLGYVALIIDPVGAGEREITGSGTAPAEHRLLGRQFTVANWSLAGLQAWDARRAIDYLVSRAEVDDTRIGVTGTSGGGTQAVLVAAIDDRITMLAPSCFLTKFVNNIEHELWGDHEQWPLEMLRHGFDFDDFLVAFLGPGKRLHLIAQLDDFFDLGDAGDGAPDEGVKAIFARMQSHCTKLGLAAPTLFVDTNQHQLDKDGRESAYAFFADASGSGFGTTEPTLIAETEQDLWATATGSVLDEVNASTQHEILVDLVAAAATARGTPTGATLLNRVREVLRLPDYDSGALDLTDPTVRVVVTRLRYWGGYAPWTNDGAGIVPAITPPNYPKPFAIRYGIETEAGIFATAYYLTNSVWHSRPPRVVSGHAVIYVPHLSADQELSQPGRESLISAPGASEPYFFALDVRGIGESLQATNAESSSIATAAGDDFYAQIADALGEPFLGRVVWDVLRTMDLLAAYGFTTFHLMGRGWGSLASALAGLLDNRVTHVTIKNALTRWHAVAVTENAVQVAWPMSRLLARVLTRFDLPDVYAELTATKTAFVNSAPWGAWGGLGGET